MDSRVGEIDEGRGICAAIGVGQSGSRISELFALGPQPVPVVGTVSAAGMGAGWGESSAISRSFWKLLWRAPNAKVLGVSGNVLAAGGFMTGISESLIPTIGRQCTGRYMPVEAKNKTRKLWRARCSQLGGGG